jgi:hypothetical protein
VNGERPGGILRRERLVGDEGAVQRQAGRQPRYLELVECPACPVQRLLPRGPGHDQLGRQRAVTVEVGNSDRLVQNAEASNFTSYHVPGEVYDTAVGTTGTATKVTIDAGTLTAMNVTVDVANTNETRSGLMASTLQSDTPSVLGGPLVDLNGKVIGITIGGSGSGLNVTGYAIPINTALAVATQIADGNS